MGIKNILDFFRTGIWHIEEGDLSRIKAGLLRISRILVLSLKGLWEDRIQLRASALTYYSLLSIVPVLALILGIAKGFGLEKFIEKQMLQNMQGQEAVATRILDFAQNLLENTRGGLMVGAGLLFLFWVILNVLSNIESAFNDIWGIKKDREIARKLVDYLALTFVGPFLITLSGTLTVLISSQLRHFIEKAPWLSTLGPAIYPVFKLFPYAALWILFSFLYAFMPNAKIRISSAIFAGIIAGTIYQIFQWAYISFQIGVARYNAIFGSFAALPLFLIWLHWSWLIVLYGAELSFAHQNVKNFVLQKEWAHPSHSIKKLLAVGILYTLIQAFSKEGKARTLEEISEYLGVPITSVKEVLSDLNEKGLVSEVRLHDYRVPAYQPGRDPDTITIKTVLDAMDNYEGDKVIFKFSPVLEKVSKKLAGLHEVLEKSENNTRLKDL